MSDEAHEDEKREEREEREDKGKSKFTVNDKRHWVDEGDSREDIELEEQVPTYVQKLKDEAEEKDKRLREYIAAYKAKTAETDEIRQRLQRENDGKLDQVKAKLFSQLVPILDNLKRASGAAKSSEDYESLKQGLDMTIVQFTKELEDNGVQAIKAVGRKFNPITDEACMTVVAENSEQEDVVIEELEPGYMFKDKLLKPVKVKVAKAG
jgi:molecular chaperone GrpE